MTKRELEQLCRRWQDRLGLGEWTIEARFVRAYEFDSQSDPALAEINVFPKKRWAEILVLDRLDVSPNYVPEAVAGDVELAIVHELLHIWFDPFGLYADVVDSEEIAREQAVHAVSSALVALDRRKP